MKLSKYLLYFFTMALVAGGFAACEETTPDPNPTYESAVHAYAEATSATKNFSTDAKVPVTFKWRWLSIDDLNTVNKAEMYVFFSEPYIDKDKNPKTAAHGGTPGSALPGGKQGGKLWKTIASPAANRAFTDFTITQAEVYELYKTAKFDYGNGAVDVFSTAKGRSADKPFLKGDKFEIRWVLYTTDGRKFDSWTTNVCGDFVGANCTLQFEVK